MALGNDLTYEMGVQHSVLKIYQKSLIHQKSERSELRFNLQR